MKKLSIIIAAASLALSAPVFACPHDESSPKTAEKKKDEKGTTDKAKEAPKKEEAPSTAKKKEEPKQDANKKPDKVSQK